MPKIRAQNVQAHRALTWSQVLDAFEEILLTTDYADVAISAVAAKAGVARNTVYNYAQDKGELLAGAARRHIGRLSGEAERAAAGVTASDDRLRAILQVCAAAFGSGRVSPQVFLELMRHGTSDDLTRAADGATDLLPLIVGTLRDGADAGVFALARDEMYTLDLVIGVMMTTLEAGLDDPERASEFFDDGIEFVLRALRA